MADYCNAIVQQLPASFGSGSKNCKSRARGLNFFPLGLELQELYKERKGGRRYVKCICYWGTIFISFLLYILLRIKEGQEGTSAETMKEKKVGVKLFLLLLWKLSVCFGGHCVISGAQAHAHLSNMAATASGCTVCEGCFHSTATTLFLAALLLTTAAQETGFSTKTILPSSVLFAW